MAEGQTTVTLSPAQLEQLIRRIVREEVSRLLQSSKPSVLDDWSHEGPEDPEGDAELLQEALEVIRQRKQDPEASVGWEEFKAELRTAEAAGGLPD
jgi:hypothetical protein